MELEVGVHPLEFAHEWLRARNANKCEDLIASRAIPDEGFIRRFDESRFYQTWHNSSFPQAETDCQPCGFQTAPLPDPEVGDSLWSLIFEVNLQRFEVALKVHDFSPAG